MDLTNIRIALAVETGMVASGLATGLRLFERFVSDSGAVLGRLSGVFDKIAASAKFAGPLGKGLAAVALAMGLALGPAIAFQSAFAGV